MAPEAYPRRTHLKGPPIGFALTLPSNSKTQLERVNKGMPSSLLCLVISDKDKDMTTLTPGVNVINFFFIADDKAKQARVFAPGKNFAA